MRVVMKKKYYKVQCHRCESTFAFDSSDITFVNINCVDNERVKCPCCNVDILKYIDRFGSLCLNFTEISERDYLDIVKNYRRDMIYANTKKRISKGKN